jgi:ABC-type nitrate/sulfonate/bicarbonate transport system ATPase subunit
MIDVSALGFAYESSPILIFDQFSWSLAKGRTCTILGPSGCGKTSLLYLLAGILKPQKGTITIAGQRLQRPRPGTGLILQDYGLLPWASVWKNVELGFAIRGFYGPDGMHSPRVLLDPKTKKQRIESWLNRLGLANFQNKYPHQLSGGQRQRTAIARTLVLQPDLLLMDEPFSSLDAPTRESLQDLTINLCREEGITLVLVTHSIEEAALVGQEILLLAQPPNQSALVFQNPGASSDGYRSMTEYQDLCLDLRSRMGNYAP